MASVRIRFLGSGDALGSGGRLQTCILIESNGHSCLVDCGASSLIALKRAGVDPNDIGTVLISHLHEDHFGGLPFLILDGQFSSRSNHLRVAGPPGLKARVTEAMEVFFPGSSGARRKFEVQFQEIPTWWFSILALPNTNWEPRISNASTTVKICCGRKDLPGMVSVAT